MKDIIIAAAALAAIILVRIIISFAWSPHAGEVFCRPGAVLLLHRQACRQPEAPDKAGGLTIYPIFLPELHRTVQLRPLFALYMSPFSAAGPPAEGAAYNEKEGRK